MIASPRPLFSFALVAVFVLTIALAFEVRSQVPTTVANRICCDAREPISSLPYVINQSGSYVVTGWLTGTTGKDGITINASNVTIDLNGFGLQGVPGSNTGILDLSPSGNVRVYNGTIRGWDASGIDCGDYARLEEICAIDNELHGLLTGAGSAVIRCSAIVGTADPGSSFAGIRVGEGSLVLDCIAYKNGSLGIEVGRGSTLAHSASTRNSNDGINAAGGSCSLTMSSSTDNAGAGFHANDALLNSDAGVGNAAGDYTGTGNAAGHNR